MRTKWYYEFENRNNTGEKVYHCQIPKDDEVFPRLMILCYFPSENRAWFWTMFSDDDPIRFKCNSWNDAETMKRILNSDRKNHWMDPCKQSEHKNIRNNE